MSSNTPQVIVATGLTQMRDCTIKGIWNDNVIFIGQNRELIIVDKNIHEHGGGQNVRCLVKIENGIAIATSYANKNLI